MFWKSSRKLTPRKRFVLWGGVFLVLLVSVLTIILLTNQKKKVSPASLPKEQLTLIQAKTQAISQTQNLISDKKIKESDLLIKLKEEKLLKPNETDWRSCFNLETANSLDKLDNFKKKILTIVNSLPATPAPGPDSPPPQPGPSPVPNNKEDLHKYISDDAIEFACNTLKNEKNLPSDVRFVGDTTPTTDFATETNIYTGNNHNFYYYDSMGGGNSVPSDVKDKFCATILVHGDPSLNINDKLKPKLSPRQNDGYNCGMFTIANIEYFADKLSSGSGNPDEESFWDIPESKRTEISNNILQKRSY
ncbi:3932_t:CDS:2 [Funneliformis geosporum]|nr:3932_t:CDS:2 [Funneliformis geosporum]